MASRDVDQGALASLRRCGAAGPVRVRGPGCARGLQLAAACDGGNAGEECYLEVAGSIAPLDVHQQYVTLCTGLSDSCPSVSLPSGVCDLDQVILFSAAHMQETVLPCFDLACDQVSACLETNVLDAF